MTAAAEVSIIGAGLAGCEAALSLAARGIPVRLFEQKPVARTEAQSSDSLCELVCSNSFRGAALSNAVGLLKEEMRRLGSHVMQVAELTKVPAGGALAVDREAFAAEMSRRVRSEPRIQVIDGVITSMPAARPCIVATGPLTGAELAADIARRVGSEHLAYYDAIAPIIDAESIDWDKVFVASRYGKGETEADQQAYVNCPLDREQYLVFVDELRRAQKVEPKSFEDVRYFEGCLPVEVMAARGELTLRFGPMKSVGLDDPRTGRWPFAVVQLRKEDAAGSAYNLVGFQTRMTWPEQARVFRTIPGLEQAEFLRMGSVHRNTFICAPKCLGPTLELVGEPGLYFAGQITGTEGYVESAAGGWLAAYFVAEQLAGRTPVPPPVTTAHGGLLTHLSRPNADYQPSNITFAHLPPLEGGRLKKRARYEALAARALADLEVWWAAAQSTRAA